MKKLLIAVVMAFVALFFSACGKDPIAEIESCIETEKNPTRRELFAEFAQIFRRERNGQPFDATRGLALSVIFDYPDFAEFFIEKGAGVNGNCFVDINMLAFAAKQHFFEICRLLVAHGADVNSRSWKGETPLVLALSNTDYKYTSSVRRLSDWNISEARAERKKIVEFLFEKGADINAKTNNGKTPLYYAASAGDKEMMEWLIDRGAVHDPRELLSIAFKNSGDEYLSLLEYSLKLGVPKKTISDFFGKYVVEFAGEMGEEIEKIKLLMKYGADASMEVCKEFGISFSALDVAVARRNRELFRTFVEAGTDLNRSAKKFGREHDGFDFSGKSFDLAVKTSPLIFALEDSDGKDFSFAEDLLKRGADVNAFPVLAYFCGKGEKGIPVVKFLLKHGADPNLKMKKDGIWATPLLWAIGDLRYASGNLEIVKLLLENGGDPNVEILLDDKSGKMVPAIVFALVKGKRELFLLLKEKGAKLSAIFPATVKIPGRDYAFGKFEVTQKEYELVMGANPSHFKGENLPVECVSWNDAVAFCEKLTEWARAAGLISETQSYRLPTEKEWEHACRAGTTTQFYTGDSDEDLARAAWYRDNSGLKTHPVGQKEPNAFGLYDMHGNVCEWTSTSIDSRRLNRGDSWSDSAGNCRASYHFRFGNSPDNRYNILGFRLVLDPAD